MNEKLLALPQEKQDRILNAALAVFAQNEYKRASTDEIADPAQCLRMLTWMADGWLNEKRRRGVRVDVHVTMQDFEQWAAMLRVMAYREALLPPKPNGKEEDSECN